MFVAALKFENKTKMGESRRGITRTFRIVVMYNNMQLPNLADNISPPLLLLLLGSEHCSEAQVTDKHWKF